MLPVAIKTSASLVAAWMNQFLNTGKDAGWQVPGRCYDTLRLRLIQILRESDNIYIKQNIRCCP
jgi:hypothetical protein